MVDLVITASDVVAQTGARTTGAIASEAIDAGESIYLNSSGQAALANSETSAVTAAAVGIALNNAALNQPVSYISAGDVNLGVTLSIGKIYVLSGTSGGIAPIDDITLAANEWVTEVGYGSTAALLTVSIKATGVQAGADVT